MGPQMNRLRDDIYEDRQHNYVYIDTNKTNHMFVFSVSHFNFTTTCFDSNGSSSGVLHKRKLIGTEIICELIVAAFNFYIYFNCIIG
jgi:hypothetical protein